jgi:hypothetical protein
VGDEVIVVMPSYDDKEICIKAGGWRDWWFEVGDESGLQSVLGKTFRIYKINDKAQNIQDGVYLEKVRDEDYVNPDWNFPFCALMRKEICELYLGDSFLSLLKE